MKKKFLLGLLIGVVCSWLAVRKIDWHEVGQAFSILNWLPILLIPIWMVVTHFFRAVRWQIMLRPIARVSLWRLFAINAVGFLGIHLFPLRLGELVRPMLLKRRENIPFSSGLATIALERAFDGMVVVLFLLIGIWEIAASGRDMPLLTVPLFGPVKLQQVGLLAAGIFLPLLLFLLLAVLRRAWAMWVVNQLARVLPEKVRVRVELIAGNFIDGLAALPSVRSVLGIFLCSLGVWGAMVFAYSHGFQAFGFALPWSAPFALLGVASLGIGLPAAPGFVGTFEIAVIIALTIFGISKPVALAYSLVMHILVLGFAVVLGVGFLPVVAAKMGTLYSQVRTQGTDNGTKPLDS